MEQAILPPTWKTLGAAAVEALDRAFTVRAMAFVLAASTANLDDALECDILLSEPEMPGADPLYSRHEIDDCLDDAREQAGAIRMQMEAMHVAA